MTFADLSRAGLLASVAVLAASVFVQQPARSESAVVIPPPASSSSETPDAGPRKLVVAGGCFWGVQAVFQHVKGVTSAVSGYAGGSAMLANYPAVSTGATGHAEAVEITYDPAVVSAGKLLQVFFSVAHDPTELDRQGPDVGTQYRSGVFADGESQTGLTKAYVAQLDEAKVFGSKIVTKIEPLQKFFPAEAYHQDYLVRHPRQPYIATYDMPKLENLKRMFPDLYRPEPKLVGPAS